MCYWIQRIQGKHLGKTRFVWGQSTILCSQLLSSVIFHFVLSEEKAQLIYSKCNTLRVTWPWSFLVSPNMVEIKELFPQPTCPTMAKSSRSATSILILKKTKHIFSAWKHERVSQNRDEVDNIVKWEARYVLCLCSAFSSSVLCIKPLF